MTKLTRILRSLPGRRRAGDLAAAAGQAPRRGTVLVLILGALALISVVTLIYVTVGRGDRRTATTTVERSRIDSTVHHIGDYINGVISRGTLATFVDGIDTPPSGTATPILIRKMWDYPWTDSYPRSVYGGTITRKFDPSGSYADPITGADPRVPHQPWLAATAPCLTRPPSSRPQSPPPFDREQDWWQISNFAPDGRFVNLWNLAPNIGGQRVSGFDAAPVRRGANASWIPQVPVNTANGVLAEMSYGLTTLDPNGKSYNVGASQIVLPSGPVTALPNVPAHWTMWQQQAFRMSGVDPNFGPGDYQYAPYQWADADGDGFDDSRWFEPTDASDSLNAKSLLPRDDRFRWFIAARAVDLSALINVNTAMDQRVPARHKATLPQVTPLGLYPCDIDLYRALRMNDVYQIYGPQTGYRLLQAPALLGSADDYTRYDIGLARRIGETAYNAIRLTLRPESVAVPDALAPLTTSLTGPLTALTGDQRTEYYIKLGSQSTAGYFVSTAKSWAVPGRFGMADLLELLTNRTSNNPEVTSRLEQAADGRFTQINGGSANDDRIGPLRSGRTRAAETGGMDDAEPAGPGNGVPDADAWAKIAFDVRQRYTTLSGARPLVSSVVPTPGVTPPPPGGIPSKLTSAEVATDAVDAAWKASDPTASNRDPAPLFKAYANALLPYAWRNEHWTTNYGTFRTLSFAHDPELALRYAGVMTANFGDMFDQDNDSTGAAIPGGQPGAYTLLIDRSQRNTMTSSTTAYPWWNQGNSGRLDLGDALLPDSSAGVVVSSTAINIFGIEAQPFITQVCSFCLYTDTPNALGGDPDYNPLTLGPITISGTITAGSIQRPNRDYLGQVLAFQLTNPFQTTIALSNGTQTTNFQALTGTDSFTDFYLEYNGNLFKLAKDATGGVLQGVVLQPGETRTFYALADTIEEMQARWVAAAGTAHPILPDAVERFLDNQLAVPVISGVTYGAQGVDLTTGGDRVKPIRLRRMEPIAGLSTGPAGDFFANGSLQARREVYLWRVIPQSGSAARTSRERHYLADCIRDPGPSIGSTEATLDRRAPSSNQDINGTLSGPEPTPGDPIPAGHDNTGFSIALWGSVKRGDNPVTTPLGAIPAYCLEAKWAGGNLKNYADTDGAKPDALRQNDFTSSANGDVTLQKLIAKTIIPVIPGGVRPQPTNPGGFAGVLVTAGGTYATMTAPAHLKRYSSHFLTTNAAGVSFGSLYPQIPLDTNNFEANLTGVTPTTKVSTLRVADMLLPLAIGPMYDPGTPAPVIAPGQSIDPLRCLSLSEALGLALNYSNPPQAGDPFSIYHRIGDRSVPAPAGVPSAGSLDRGNLALDRFCPFEDRNANLLFDPPTPSGGDAPRWPGIPLALNVLNSFRTLDPQFGSMTRLTPGQININTTTLPVARSLPLLSPPTDVNSLPGQAGNEWDVHKVLAGMAPSDRPLPDFDSDIAASVIAYRDKTRTVTRDLTPATALFEDFVVDPFAPYGADGRFRQHQIQGAREAPGMATIGELMAVTTSPTATANPPLRPTDRIDMLGDDTRRSGLDGTASVLYKNAAGNKVVDEIIDDYQEKLLVAQSLLNSVSVRSDVFAVWFVVHGYQRSDTENLGPADPLVPSVAKRFLMILDRSNVTRAGEKAKVLLFTELPM